VTYEIQVIHTQTSTYTVEADSAEAAEAVVFDLNCPAPDEVVVSKRPADVIITEVG